MKVIFWNIEGLSLNVVKKAERAAQQYRDQAEKLQLVAKRHQPARRVLRSDLRKTFGSGIKKNSRSTRAAIVAQRALFRAEEKAKQMRSKYQLSRDLPKSGDAVFYCEVLMTYGDWRSSLMAPEMPNTATKCYAYYSDKVSAAFTDDPVKSASDVQGLDRNSRVPKCVSLNWNNKDVMFCFWHAPSGNNGKVVVDMYNYLKAQGGKYHNFVLFGDLNVEPQQLESKGIPGNAIVGPIQGTRISNRKLDYAVKNGDFKLAVRALDTKLRGYAIKTGMGSDHMPMILEATS